MAQYKVPQDVEADDKLLGPFSFRQFVYLLIAGGLIACNYTSAVYFIAWRISITPQERSADGDVFGSDCVILSETKN